MGESLEPHDPSQAFAALSLMGSSNNDTSPPKHLEELVSGIARCSASPSSSNLGACRGDDPKSPVLSHPQQQMESTGRPKSSGMQQQVETCGPAKPPVPADFCCPISMDIMRDPVLVATGQTYDKVCIERWLNSGRRTCPKTGVRLRHTELTPNIALRNIIQVLLRCVDLSRHNLTHVAVHVHIAAKLSGICFVLPQELHALMFMPL
jgi:hypothetical protein